MSIDSCHVSLVNSETRSQEKNEHVSASTSGSPRIRPEQGSGQALQGENLGAGEQAPAERPEKTGSAPHKVRTGQGASWKAEYTRFAETLQGRQYDSKTARAYTKWVRKLQAFTRSKAPDSLSPEDASAFLVSLPKKRRMTVSKQNQVYDALLDGIVVNWGNCHTIHVPELRTFDKKSSYPVDFRLLGTKKVAKT